MRAHSPDAKIADKLNFSTSTSETGLKYQEKSYNFVVTNLIAVMEVPVIKIGNSKGILLSKTILERYGFGEKIEIVMKQGHIELQPVTPPRQGWDEAFREMHERGGDELLDDDVLDDDFLEEWEWR
jgi:antitoxin MazE